MNENCCDDGHCCPSGQTCCGGTCCNTNQCQECVLGVCSPGYCTLATIVIDESSCTCQESACQGSGQIYYFYMCYNDHCPDSCYCKSTKSLQVTEQVPWCQDIGYWPPGPACNEKEDCAMSGYEEIYNMSINTCSCVPYGT
jgi:hypothetical protein